MARKEGTALLVASIGSCGRLTHPQRFRRVSAWLRLRDRTASIVSLVFQVRSVTLPFAPSAQTIATAGAGATMIPRCLLFRRLLKMRPQPMERTRLMGRARAKQVSGASDAKNRRVTLTVEALATASVKALLAGSAAELKAEAET